MTEGVEKNRGVWSEPPTPSPSPLEPSRVSSVTCVLLGVAEVKVPLKRLPPEVLSDVAVKAQWAVLHVDTEVYKDSKEAKECQKFIGEVDSYYGLREVKVEVEGRNCQITQGAEVILQHTVRDVIVTTVLDEKLQVIYLSKCSSYVRAAVVLQIKSKQDMQQFLALFPNTVSTPPITDSSDQIPSMKSSWSRGVGKRFTELLTTIANPALQARRSPRPVRKTLVVPEAIINAEHSSDSDSDDDSVTDDTDSSKSAGEYYEERGLDAKAQEGLYEDSSETSSISSGSSIESNTSIIEAELNFFLETDREFVKAIKSLADDKEKLVNGDTPQRVRTSLTLLFVQVSALTDLHIQLHSEFEKCSHDLQQLSEAIIKHQADYENYVYFMENIPTVDRILQMNKEYFKENVPSMAESLRKPRMRLHYYVLTLETLLKRSSNPDDKAALKKAMGVLKGPLKRADSKLFLGAVTGSPVDLSNFGTLIRHSDLTLRRGPGYLARRAYHVLMLKDLILLTIRNGMDYTYITSFRMDEVGLGRHERGQLFSLLVRNGPRGQEVVYTFKAKNISTQQLWINDLKSFLAEKSLPTTPRSSLIECDSDGRHSRVRRGPSIEKGTIRSSNLGDPSNCDNQEEVRAGRTDFNTSWTGSGRRAAMKKSSSASSRSRPVVRQQSGYMSDGESCSSKIKISDYLPLTVWQHFPYMRNLYDQTAGPLGTDGTPRALMNDLLEKEKVYISNMNTILSDRLEEDVPKAPWHMVTHVRHLHEFHAELFLPMLKKSISSGDKSEVAQCFVDCSEKLKELYPQYLADMSRSNDELLEMTLLNTYKIPLRQLKLYIEHLSTLQQEDEEVIPSIQGALSTLRDCMAIANTILLTETIEGAPFDLEEQGSVLFESPAKVKKIGVGIRQVYYVVLLDTMVLLLEPHPPNYHYVDALRMDTVGLGPPINDHSFQLEVRTAATKTVSYVFRPPTPETKTRWLIEISKLLHLQVQKLKDRQKRRLGCYELALKDVIKDTTEEDKDDLHKVTLKGSLKLHKTLPEQCQSSTEGKALETHM